MGGTYYSNWTRDRITASYLLEKRVYTYNPTKRANIEKEYTAKCNRPHLSIFIPSKLSKVLWDVWWLSYDSWSYLNHYSYRFQSLLISEEQILQPPKTEQDEISHVIRADGIREYWGTTKDSPADIVKCTWIVLF